MSYEVTFLKQRLDCVDAWAEDCDTLEEAEELVENVIEDGHADSATIRLTMTYFVSHYDADFGWEG